MNLKELLFAGAFVGIAAMATAQFCAGPFKEMSQKTTLPVSECEDRLLRRKSFEVKRSLGWAHKMNVYAENEKIGVIYENPLAFGVHLDIYAGNEEKRIGYTDQRLTFNHESDIFDGEGRYLGAISQRGFAMTSTYDVKNEWKQPVARAKVQFFTIPHTMDFTTPDGKLSLGGSRMDRWLPNYQVNIDPNIKLDNRVTLTLVAIENYLEEKAAEDDD